MNANSFKHRHECLRVQSFAYRAGFNFFGDIPRFTENMEAILIVEGSARLFCGPETHDLQTGDLCFIAPETIHYLGYAPELRSLHLDLQLTGSAAAMLPEDARLCMIPVNTGALSLVPLLDLFLGSEGRLIRTRENWQSVIDLWSSLLTEVFCLYAGSFSSYEQNPMICDIFRYMVDNSHEKLTMDMLSKRYYISQSYLSRIFHDYTGLAPMETFLRVRMLKAAAALLNADDSITNIAHDSGYSNIAAFQKAFYRRYQCSPTEFRRLYKESYSGSRLIYNSDWPI